jgi:hypothetical protein
MVIHSGGAMLIGGGESSRNFFKAEFTENGEGAVLLNKKSEDLFLLADSDIYMYTNCNTIDNKKLALKISTEGMVQTVLNGAGFMVTSTD